MGGGDLNLKKSWHPSTLRNIERVWKAEQKHEVEKQKIEQLQKELAEERAREEIQAYAEDQGVVKKREERLDWMYQGPAAMVNRDEYLLGRKIDKTLELLEQHENGTEPKKDDFEIGSSMFSSQDLSGTATVDLANKIREDPLFSIMKKEKEQKKNLLLNPVKMKQLQQMIQESLNKGKKKKSKKSKRHDDDDDSERKYHKKHKKSKHHYHSSDDERMPTNLSKKKQYSPSEEKYYRNVSSSNSYENRKSKNSSTREIDPSYSSKYTSKNSDHHSTRKNSSFTESYSTASSSYNHRDSNGGSKRKMDDDERERRLKEMQDNAKWREQQRKRNVKRYKDDDDREEEKANKVDSSDFIKPMLSKAVGKGSLENRVKQKIFSIQRSSADMDRHFARR